jgi:hypothetical protein
MNLPTRAQWQGVLLLDGAGDGYNCKGSAAPFDQAAMPTSAADMNGSYGGPQFWTSEPETGFPGFAFTLQVYLTQQPPNYGWGYGYGDGATGDSTAFPYRCVK